MARTKKTTRRIAVNHVVHLERHWNPAKEDQIGNLLCDEIGRDMES